MTTKSDFLLHEALSMNPNERARMAHCLINSLDHPPDEDVEEQWIKLAEKRLAELENGVVKPVSWEEIKRKVKG